MGRGKLGKGQDIYICCFYNLKPVAKCIAYNVGKYFTKYKTSLKKRLNSEKNVWAKLSDTSNILLATSNF